MKELVDFKLGKKPMDRYVKDYDYKHQQPEEKFRKMSQRLHAISDDSESSASEKEPEPPKDRKIRFEDTYDESTEPSSADSVATKTTEDSKDKPSEDSKDEPSEDSEDSEDEPSEDEEKLTETQESLTSETSNTTGQTQPFEVQPTDVDRLRFLLSGHIRHDLKPIFIFHEYNGKSPFGKTPDFTSVKNEGEVDLYIRGKFYQDNILEEVNNKLLSLNIKPDKILIDERSKVHEEQFYEMLRVGKVNVDFQGKFIKQLDTKKYTPLLTFNVKNYPIKKKRAKNKSRTKKPAAVVYTAHPESQNIFEQKQEEQERVSNEKSGNKPMNVPKKKISQTTTSVPKPGGDVNEYEPHLKKNPSKRPSMNQTGRRGRDAGDIGSEGGLVYNCDVNRRRSSKDKHFFRRLSDMFFSRN